MICDICSDTIEPGEGTVMHNGKPVHESCYLIKDDVIPGPVPAPEPEHADVAQPPSAVDHPDELELAYRRGDEVETVMRGLRVVADVGAACSRGADEIMRLRNENAVLMVERDAARRRCKELTSMARLRVANRERNEEE